MGVVKKAKAELEKAYEESGILVISDALNIIGKYQEVDEVTGMMPEFSINAMQEDALRLTALNFTIHSYLVEHDANSGRAKAKVKYEKARQFNLIKKADIKKSDRRCENEAEEGVYQFVLDDIEKRKVSQYLDIASQRIIDMVNMLKKTVERVMWQGVQPG